MSDGFVVIVEGCDKCGKSTLAGRLSSALGWPVVKFSQPAGDAFTEYWDALTARPGPFVADRFHMGENVYGPIYRNTPPMLPSHVQALEGRLLDRGALLVLMEDDADRVVGRFAALGENFARAHDVGRILRAYDREWRESRLPKLRAELSDGLAGHVARSVLYAAAWKR